MHCAICAFGQYARFSQIQSHVTRYEKPSIWDQRTIRVMYCFSTSGQKLIFVTSMSNNPSSVTVTYGGLRRRNELDLQSVQLPCTELVAKGVNWNSRVWAILDTDRFVELLNIVAYRHRRSSSCYRHRSSSLA